MRGRINTADICLFAILSTVAAVLFAAVCLCVINDADFGGKNMEKTCVVYFNVTFGACAIRFSDQNDSCPIDGSNCTPLQFDTQKERTCYNLPNAQCPALTMGYIKWDHILNAIFFGFIATIMSISMCHWCREILTRLDTEEKSYYMDINKRIRGNSKFKK